MRNVKLIACSNILKRILPANYQFEQFVVPFELLRSALLLPTIVRDLDSPAGEERHDDECAAHVKPVPFRFGDVGSRSLVNRDKSDYSRNERQGIAQKVKEGVIAHVTEPLIPYLLRNLSSHTYDA